jgi:hypothetical protein
MLPQSHGDNQEERGDCQAGPQACTAQELE